MISFKIRLYIIFHTLCVATTNVEREIFQRMKVASIALALARLVAYAVFQNNIYVTFLVYKFEL